MYDFFVVSGISARFLIFYLGLFWDCWRISVLSHGSMLWLTSDSTVSKL